MATETNTLHHERIRQLMGFQPAPATAPVGASGMSTGTTVGTVRMQRRMSEGILDSLQRANSISTKNHKVVVGYLKTIAKELTDARKRGGSGSMWSWLNPFKGGLFGGVAVGGMFKKLLGVGGTALKWGGGLLGGLAMAAVGGITSMLGSAFKSMPKLGGAALGSAMRPVMTSMQRLAGQALSWSVGLASSVWSKFGSPVAAAGSTAMRSISNLLSGGRMALPGGMAGMLSKLKGLAGGGLGRLSGLGRSALSVGGRLMGGPLGLIAALGMGGYGAFQGWNNAGSLLGRNVGPKDLQGKISGALGSALAMFGTDYIAKAFGHENTAQVIDSMVTKSREWIGGVADKISDTAKSAFQATIGVARDTLNSVMSIDGLKGLRDSIVSGAMTFADSVKDYASGLFNSAKGWLRDLFEPSPSSGTGYRITPGSATPVRPGSPAVAGMLTGGLGVEALLGYSSSRPAGSQSILPQTEIETAIYRGFSRALHEIQGLGTGAITGAGAGGPLGGAAGSVASQLAGEMQKLNKNLGAGQSPGKKVAEEHKAKIGKLIEKIKPFINGALGKAQWAGQMLQDYATSMGQPLFEKTPFTSGTPSGRLYETPGRSGRSSTLGPPDNPASGKPREATVDTSGVGELPKEMRAPQVDSPDFSNGGESRYDKSIPANVRHNNPGATYPAEWMNAYGMQGHDIIGGGHKIAHFPDAVSGAAANMDLMSRGYAGMKLGDFIHKWSGGNSSGAYTSKVASDLGISENTVITKEMINDPGFGPKLLKSMSTWEGGGKNKFGELTEDQWQAAHSKYREVNGLGGSTGLPKQATAKQLGSTYERLSELAEKESDPAKQQRMYEQMSQIDRLRKQASEEDTRRASADKEGKRSGMSDADAHSVISAAAQGRLSPQAAAVDKAMEQLGLHEDNDREKVRNYLKSGGQQLDPADQPWCAAFVNSSLEQSGVKGLEGDNKYVANEFQRWGKDAGEDVGKWKKGDVLIKHRDLAPGEVGGHVGQFTGKTREVDGETQVEMISGNSHNRVERTWENASELMARRSHEQDAIDRAPKPSVDQSSNPKPAGSPTMGTVDPGKGIHAAPPAAAENGGDGGQNGKDDGYQGVEPDDAKPTDVGKDVGDAIQTNNSGSDSETGANSGAGMDGPGLEEIDGKDDIYLINMNQTYSA